MLWFQGARSGLTEPDPATARSLARGPGPEAASPGRLGQDGAMTTDTDGYHLYSDLAAWWPLISPPEEYAEEAGFAARLLGQAARPVREVLELAAAAVTAPATSGRGSR